MTLLAACGGEGTVVVHLDLPPGQRPGVQIAYLPYDSDADPSPPPVPPVLAARIFDTLPRRLTEYRAGERRKSGLQSRLDSLEQRLDSIPRSTAAYQRVFSQHRRLAEALRAASREQQTAFESVVAVRATLDTAADAYAAVLADWLSQDGGRQDQTESEHLDSAHITTDRMERTLPRGTHWVRAKAADPGNPYGELYWHVPVRIRAGRITRVTLCRANAQVRFRGTP